MRVYFKTILVVAIVVAVSHLLSGAFKEFNVPKDTMEIFFGLFGVVYAIIIGFAIYEVLGNYNEIKHCMNAEVNELQDLRDYLMYVDGQEEAKKEIASHIKGYAESVIKEEWPSMCNYKDLDVDTPREMYEVMKSVNKIKPANESDLIALEKLINTIGVVTTYRTNRITASIERLPALLKQLILILSFFMVATFALTPIEPASVKFALTALNTFGIVFIYFVITDLDYPFGGVWSIEPVPYSHFVSRFKD